MPTLPKNSPISSFSRSHFHPSQKRLSAFYEISKKETSSKNDESNACYYSSDKPVRVLTSSEKMHKSKILAKVKSTDHNNSEEEMTNKSNEKENMSSNNEKEYFGAKGVLIERKHLDARGNSGAQEGKNLNAHASPPLNSASFSPINLANNICNSNAVLDKVRTMNLKNNIGRDTSSLKVYLHPIQSNNCILVGKRYVDGSQMRTSTSHHSKTRRCLSRTNQRRCPSNDEYALYRHNQKKKHQKTNSNDHPCNCSSSNDASTSNYVTYSPYKSERKSEHCNRKNQNNGIAEGNVKEERLKEGGGALDVLLGDKTSYYTRGAEGLAEKDAAKRLDKSKKYDHTMDEDSIENIIIDIPSLHPIPPKRRRNLVRPVSRYEKRVDHRRREYRRPHATDILAYRGVAGSTVRSLVENILVKPAKSCLNLEFDERAARFHHFNHDIMCGGGFAAPPPVLGWDYLDSDRRKDLNNQNGGYYHHNHHATYCSTNYYTDPCEGEVTSQDTVPLYPMYQLPENDDAEGLQGNIIERRRKGNLEPVTLTFKNLRFSIPNRKRRSGETVIVDSISGVFYPGEMIAIMGPSGCGKTTLLDMLANKKSAKYTGEVFVNGQPRDAFFKRIATYVSQDELYNGNEKVREVLEFSSRLRMNYAWTGMGEELRQKNIDETLEYLGLDHVQNSRVGNSVIRGVSGGQKRRLTLGRGVLSDAYIGFCDEPTSGLSPSDTELVLQAIKNMSKLYQMIFVIVIHQPRWEAFQKFDKFILLSGGRCIYNGPANKAQAYFAKLGFVCPSHLNPADFFLDLVTPGFPGACPDKLADYYTKHMASKVFKQVEKSLTEPHTPISEAIKSGPCESSDHMYAVTRWQQFKLVTKRFIQYWRRDTATIESILTNAILQALLVGFVFFSVRSDRTVFQQLSSLFLIGVFVLLSTLSNVPLIVSQREQYVFEVGDAYYSPFSYLCSQQLTCYTVLLFCNTLMVSIAWSLMGFQWNHFPFALLIILLAYIAMDGLVSIFALSAENFAQANSAASFCLMFTAIFNGFNSNPNSMPMWFGWVSYLSPFFYLFEGLSIELFEDYDFDSYIKRNPNELIYTNVEMIWETYGMAGRAYGNKIDVTTYKWLVDVGMLFVMAVTARVCMMLYQANCVRLKK